MKYWGWVKISECISFSAWVFWKSNTFYRFCGFEWEK